MSQNSTSLRVRPFPLSHNRKTEPIDDKPLTGRERYQLECLVLGKATRSRQLLLHRILNFLGGRADCFPSNATMATQIGVTARRVKMLIRELEQAEIIKSICDRSIPSQRRLILIDHPHALKVLRILAENDHVAASNRALRGEICFTPRMHLGGKKSVHLGGKESVHSGGKSVSPKSYLSTTSSANPVVSPPPPKTEESKTCCVRAREWLADPDAPSWKLDAARSHLNRCQANV